MKRVKTPIKISGPDLSLDDVARIYKISKKRQREIHEMVVARGWVKYDKTKSSESSAKPRKASGTRKKRA